MMHLKWCNQLTNKQLVVRGLLQRNIKIGKNYQSLHRLSGRKKNSFFGVLGSHVNDLFCGSTMFHRNVTKTVNKKYKISAEASNSLTLSVKTTAVSKLAKMSLLKI